MIRYSLLAIALSFVMMAVAQDMDPLDKVNSQNANRLLNKELSVITPEVVEELVGSWYEDRETFLDMMIPGGLVKKSLRSEAIKKGVCKETYGDETAVFIVYSDLTAVNLPARERMPIVIKRYRIEIPNDIEAMNVYRVGRRFYRGSHEFGLISLRNTRFC